MKKQIIKSMTMIAIAIVTSTTVQAQHKHEAGENHEHKAPHGGIVKTADKQHIEMVRGADKKGNQLFTFYLLDGEEKTLTNKGRTAVVMYQTSSGISEQVALTLSGDDKFVFTGAKDANYINLIVSIKEGDKSATAKFEIKPAMVPVKKQENNDGHTGHQH